MLLNKTALSYWGRTNDLYFNIRLFPRAAKYLEGKTKICMVEKKKRKKMKKTTLYLFLRNQVEVNCYKFAKLQTILS